MSKKIIATKKRYTFDIIVLLVYSISLILIMYFHEPWFDEAQSWLIARDASIRDLLGSITHYEGHPPVWIFLLMPFAKTGIPFEIGIKSLNFLFLVSAMGLFIFKAPFNRIIRFTVPFTYFFFYQYGVISRTYSLMMLGFVLCAITYRTRNEKPYHFAGALSIICSSSAYGIVIAAGISLVWLSEFTREFIKKRDSLAFIKSRSLHALIMLFSINFLFVMLIYPYSDTYAANLDKANSFPLRIFYMFFMAPADALITNSFSYGNNINVSIRSLDTIIIGCLINLIIIIFAKRLKKVKLFVIPYALFAIFSASVYFSPHHIGIIAMFYMFLFWCMFNDRTENKTLPEFIQKIVHKETDIKYLKFLGVFMVAVVILIPLYWNVTASVNDIMKNYGTGSEVAAFLKEHKLDTLSIMAAWRKNVNQDTGKEKIDYNVFQGIPTLAYFNNNIFYNFNGGSNNKCYLTHKIDSSGYFTKQLAEKGYPDVLFGSVDLKVIFPEANLTYDYALVFSAHGNMIWKDETFENRQFVFLRRDLLKDYPECKELDLKEERISLFKFVH